MASVVWPGTLHRPLCKAALVLFAATTAAAVGCGGGPLSRVDSNSGSIPGAGVEHPAGEPTSYQLSLDQDRQLTRRASYKIRETGGLVVTGSYEEDSRAALPTGAGDDKALAYLNTRVEASLGDNLPDAQMEFSSSAHSLDRGAGFSSQDSSNSFRFDLQHAGQGFGYGFNFFSVGKDFSGRGKSERNPRADRQGKELWGLWRLGRLGIRPLLQRSHDNLEVDPDRPRLTDTQVGLTLDHSVLSWPYLGYSVSYLSGTRRSSLEPEGYESYSGPVSTAALSLNYAAGKWGASLHSSRDDSENSSSGDGNQNTTLSHYLSGSYYPNHTISLTGEVGHVRDEYKAQDATTVTNDASLSLSYKPSIGNFDRFLYLSYSTQKNSEWQLDSRYLSAGAGQRWYLRRKPSVISSLSFDVSYDQYLDRASSNASTQDLTFWLRFSHTFGTRPLLAQALGYLTAPASGRLVRESGEAAHLGGLRGEDQPPDAEAVSQPIAAMSRDPASVVEPDPPEEPKPTPLDLPASAGWLAAQNAGHFTIQLSSSRLEKSARDFIRQHSLEKNAVYFPVQRDGVTWYSVFLGTYSSRGAASTAIRALPGTLQQSKPWVRKISSL